MVFLEGPFTATGVGVEAQEGGSPGVARPGHLPWWQWSFLIPSWPLLLGCLGGFAFPRMWQEGGAPHPTHLPMQVLLRHGHSPGALLGLTVTFLPELPARPTLLRWRYLRTLLALFTLLSTHVLSRHKDQRSDGFSLSLLLWGEGWESP